MAYAAEREDDAYESAEDSSGSQSKGDEKTVRRLLKWRREARDHWRPWRTEAKLCFAMTAGGGAQWDEGAKEVLRAQLRLPIEFNYTGPMVDAIVGAEINNRQEIKYYPREPGDANPTEILTAAASWARDECDAEDEESDLFRDGLICGLGAGEMRMERDVEPDGSIREERLDPLEVLVDPMAKRRNCVDARYVIHEKEYDCDEFRERFPDVKDWESLVGKEDGEEPEYDDVREDRGYRRVESDAYEDGVDEPIGNKPKTILVSHVQWWEREDVYDALHPLTGQMVEMSQSQVDRLAKIYKRAGMQFRAVPRQKRVYRRAFMAGSRILRLDEGEDFPYGGFTIVLLTGKRDRNKGRWYGLVRALVDPQRWLNKFLSQVLHILDTNAKGGLLIEHGAADDPVKFEQDYASADKNVFVSDGAISKPALMAKPQTALPAQIPLLLETTMQAFQKTTGVNAEILGLADRDQPGVLEAQRKQAAYGVLADFFASLRRFRKLMGRLLLDFLALLPPGVLVRVQEDGKQRYVPFVFQDHDIRRFDVVVDEAPAGPNQMERTLAAFVQLMPILKGVMTPEVTAEALKYMPFPQSFREKIAAALTKPNPQAQQAAQIQAAQAQADVQKTQADAQLSQAKAREALMPEQQNAMDAQIAQIEAQVKMAELRVKLRELEVQERQMQTDVVIAETQARTAAMKPRPAANGAQAA